MTIKQVRRRKRSGGESGQVNGVYERLRELIVRGQLTPGARLVERDVADRLGTSRTPVRAALQRLQQERYVTAPHGSRHARLMVAPLTIEDADELFEIVGGVEAASARRAAQLPKPARVRVTTELNTINASLLRVTQQARPDHNQIFDNYTTKAGGTGFDVEGDRNELRRNVARDGATDGINVNGHRNVVANNQAIGNNADGIENEGTFTTMKDNLSRDNKLDCANDGGTFAPGSPSGNTCADGSKFHHTTHIDGD